MFFDQRRRDEMLLRCIDTYVYSWIYMDITHVKTSIPMHIHVSLYKYVYIHLSVHFTRE